MKGINKRRIQPSQWNIFYEDSWGNYLSKDCAKVDCKYIYMFKISVLHKTFEVLTATLSSLTCSYNLC